MNASFPPRPLCGRTCAPRGRRFRGQASPCFTMVGVHRVPSFEAARVEVTRSRRSRVSHRPFVLALAFLALACFVVPVAGDSNELDTSDGDFVSISLATKDAVATKADTYTYTSASLPPGDHYITRFEPKATSKVVHHMLLFGCSGDVAPTLHTREGGMFSASGGGGQPRGAVCAGNDPEPFIFGWGKDAGDLRLPSGIGFQVGGRNGFKTLVLEVHYLNPQVPDDANTESGIVVHLRPGVPLRQMSVLAYAQGFSLPPGQKEVKVHATCAYVSSAPLTAFAFRVHTHALGTRVFLEKAIVGAGFEKRVDTAVTKKNTSVTPILLASRDPQLPQLFELVEEKAKFTIAPGNQLRVTCVFDTTNRTTPTSAGWGHGDEMCNLYLMVHAEESKYASCTGSATGGGGRSKFDLETREARHTKVEAKKTGVFVVPPPLKYAETTPHTGVESFDSQWRRWHPSLGQVSGVAFEPDGRHVWVFHRGRRVWDEKSFGDDFKITHGSPIAENTLVKLCLTTGLIVMQFGANEHYMPHGLTLGPDGDIWVTDAGAHVVIRYDARFGKRKATFGKELKPVRYRTRRDGGTDEARRAESDENDRAGFCMPTAVAVAENGQFWVSDGYCNERIARFAEDGSFVSEWGTTSIDDATKNMRKNVGFDVPHAIALHNRRSRILVADRERGHVTEHGLEGELLETHDFSEHGYVYHVATLLSEEDGMSGFYALCWGRGEATLGNKGGTRLVAKWDEGGSGSSSSRTARWDLPFVDAPHAMDVVGGGVGGTKTWKRGVSLFVTETRPKLGDVSLRRLWLGEAFNVTTNVVEPPLGWVYDEERYLKVPGLAREGPDDTFETMKIERERFGREDQNRNDIGDVVLTDTNAVDTYTDDYDGVEKIAAPQHGGGFGKFRPGGEVKTIPVPEKSAKLFQFRGSDRGVRRWNTIWGAGVLFVTALAFVMFPKQTRGKNGWGRVLEGRQRRAREETPRGVELT